MFKYSSNELNNKDISNLFFKEDLEIFQRYSNSKYSLPYEIRSIRSNGNIFFVKLLRITNIYKNKEKIDLVIIKDISEYKTVKTKLEEENEKSFNILNNINAAVILIDKNYKIESLNPIAKKIINVNNPIGKKVYKLLTLKNRYDNSLFKIKIPEYEDNSRIFIQNKSLTLETQNSQKLQILYSISPIIIKDTSNTKGAVIVFQDTTYKEKMEQELSKQEKLSSIGILAGGIAHDFNNFLASILGNITLAKELTDKKEIINLLNESENGIERATSLTKQLMTFSKGDKPLLNVVDNIDDLIKEYISFAIRGSNIKLNILKNDDKIWNCIIDKNQISQVIHNISINAKQAMPYGGEIFCKIENIEFSKEKIYQNIHITEGKYIKISIKDTGIGIKKDILSNIFDPYFTTKETGSGLGLSITYSIIRKHNGEIIVESKENEGTQITIFIPSTDKKANKNNLKKIKSDISMNNLTILIMDDEDMILKVLEKVLTKDGHEVIITKTGEEAFSKFKEYNLSNRKIDIIITDLTIPNGIGGEELAQKVLNIDKNAKLIVSSGYSSSPIMSDYKRYGFKSTLAKPYKIDQIKEAILEAMS